MIEPAHDLAISKQAKALNISRGKGRPCGRNAPQRWPCGDTSCLRHPCSVDCSYRRCWPQPWGRARPSACMGRVCTRAAEPTERYTYGFRSASILAALVNAAILLIVTGAIVWEAVRRFAEPPVVVAPTVMVVAAIAIAVNLASAWLLQGGEHDLNIRGAFMHLDPASGSPTGLAPTQPIALALRRRMADCDSHLRTWCRYSHRHCVSRDWARRAERRSGRVAPHRLRGRRKIAR
jgi:hypothetical protein